MRLPRLRLFFAAPASGATIVQNGSFEDSPNPSGSYDYLTFEALPTTGSGWNVWRSLPGWSTVYGKRDRGSDRPDPDHDRRRRWRLLCRTRQPSEPDGSNTRIVQTVSLAKAGHYSLSSRLQPAHERSADERDRLFPWHAGVRDASVGPGDLGSAVGKWTDSFQKLFLAGPERRPQLLGMRHEGHVWWSVWMTWPSPMSRRFRFRRRVCCCSAGLAGLPP